MAAALIPVIGGLAARTGVGLAASALIDKGINKGIPFALKKAREATAKHKLTKGLSKGLAKAENAYNSKGGKIAREIASTAGGIAAFEGSGKILQGAGKLGAGVGGAIKGTRIGGRIAGQFSGKKGTMISKGAKKFEKAKTNLSERITKVGKKGEKTVGRIRKRLAPTESDRAATVRQNYSNALENEIKNVPKKSRYFQENPKAYDIMMEEIEGGSKLDKKKFRL